MDYNILKDLIKQKNIRLADMAEFVGMSETGLWKAFKNNSLRVRDLEAIAKRLNMSIVQILTHNSGQKVEDPAEFYGKLDNEVDILKQKIEFLEDKIQMQSEIINLLKNKS
jgi:transcriptional regulator with XRE-family HTH domain